MELTFTPRGSCHHVRLAAVPEQSEGGLWLPDRSRTNTTQGEIVASGPGWPVPGWPGSHAVQWGEPGDTVLFQQHHFRALTPDGQEGVVRDEDLLGLVQENDDLLMPLNDWVKLLPVEGVRLSPGGIAIPDAYRYRQSCGLFVEEGPGPLRKQGRFAGYRRPVCSILGLEDECLLRPRRGRYYWAADAEVVEIARGETVYYLVRAADLVAMEEC